MNHAGTQHFDPAPLLAYSATFLSTKRAIDVHPYAGFDFGIVFTAKTGLWIGAVEQADEGVNGAFQVGHGDSLSDCKPLVLKEHGIIGHGQVFVAINLAGNDKPVWGL